MLECDNVSDPSPKQKVTEFKIFEIIILRVAHYLHKNVQNIQGDALLLFSGTSPNTRQHFVVNIYWSSIKIHSVCPADHMCCHVLSMD